ncbi:hypothetical protein [Leucobacter sp. G161]|uniref:hypothetical protein n=1 Tax=Leucobacter sp. G161 TaxID=663704 RepID=UPI000B2B464C|nr:hypothetical protein [Leucobacter sp. G161]
MNAWVIAGAIFGAIAAIGVIIQLTITAATRSHGRIHFEIVKAEHSPAGTQVYGIQIRAMGSITCNDLKVSANPVIGPYDDTPVAYFAAESEPMFRSFIFAEPRLPDHDYEPRVVYYWVSDTGFRPRPKALLVLPESLQAFDLRRSAIFPWVHFWKKRASVRHPSVVQRTVGTADPVRAVGYEQ